MTDADQLHVLLDLQAHDTKLDQLLHQQETLPAREQRNAARTALADTEASLAVETTRRDELARDQKRLDDEVESLNVKRKGYDERLYSGTVTNPRELQDLQDEIAALGRRISELEDRELVIMEAVEPVEQRLGELTTEAEQRRAVLEDAELRLTAAEAELVVAVDEAQAERDATATGISEDLLREYQSLRGGRGGIGVARLVGSQCGGCHLTLSAVEVAQLRKAAAGSVAHCEECGRILVP